jgi:hypothetical protein
MVPLRRAGAGPGTGTRERCLGERAGLGPWPHGGHRADHGTASLQRRAQGARADRHGNHAERHLQRHPRRRLLVRRPDRVRAHEGRGADTASGGQPLLGLAHRQRGLGAHGRRGQPVPNGGLARARAGLAVGRLRSRPDQGRGSVRSSQDQVVRPAVAGAARRLPAGRRGAGERGQPPGAARGRPAAQPEPRWPGQPAGEPDHHALGAADTGERSLLHRRARRRSDQRDPGQGPR